jgi:tRNA pseudouridine55 synthase
MPLQGFINVDKPAGLTAHDVVARLRKVLRVKQIGHAGTLDPMATGVLPIAVGKATRLLRFLDGTKVYKADILLGRRTTTDDIEGDTLSTFDGQYPAPDVVQAELQHFVGIQQQVPPLYSAVHMDGRRLYEMARSGEAPPPDAIPPRQVEVHCLEILENAPPKVVIRIRCAAGTYIRSIARDLGERLHCGGCLQGLIRENAGPFSLTNSRSLEDIQALVEQNQEHGLFEDPLALLPLPAMVLSKEEAQAICLGQSVKLPAQTAKLPETESSNSESLSYVHVMLCYNKQLIAIGQAHSQDGTTTVKPEVVIRDGKDIG